MSIDQTVSQINQLMRGWTGRSDEARILKLLTDCPDAVFDEVLRRLNLRRLVRNLHDRVNGPDNRTRLLKLLTETRIDQLSTETKVDLIWALQKGHTGAALELAIRNVILAARGEDLRTLRNALNLSGNFRDLPRLIFSDIDNEAIRQEILDHIAANSPPVDEFKVLSDIDDTVFARLHDRRYPAKTLYPGVLAFFNALDHGPDGNGTSGDLTFVTARPGLFVGLVAAITRRTLRKAGIRRFTILTGSLLALRSHGQMAKRKMVNIRQYHQVFPDYSLVFVGDSGQGDAEVGRLMLQELPDATRAVFIHDLDETPLSSPPRKPELGMYHFDTYIAAAAAAFDHGLITAHQALQVGSAAMKELARMKLLPPPMKHDRMEEHQEDLKALKAMIG